MVYEFGFATLHDKRRFPKKAGVHKSSKSFDYFLSIESDCDLGSRILRTPCMETYHFAQFGTLCPSGIAQEIREGRHLPNGGMDEVAWRSRCFLGAWQSDFHVSRMDIS